MERGERDQSVPSALRGGAAFLVSSCEMGSELRDTSRAVLVAKARGPVTAP